MSLQSIFEIKTFYFYTTAAGKNPNEPVNVNVVSNNEEVISSAAANDLLNSNIVHKNVQRNILLSNELIQNHDIENCVNDVSKKTVTVPGDGDVGKKNPYLFKYVLSWKQIQELYHYLPGSWIPQVITNGVQCLMWSESSKGHSSILKRIILYSDMQVSRCFKSHKYVQFLIEKIRY